MGSGPTRLHLNPQKVALRRCSSMKRGYQTYDQALDAAELMMLKGDVNPGCHITPYECDECQEFHVGNRRIVKV